MAEERAWSLVQSWLDSATNEHVVLATDGKVGQGSNAIGVTRASTLGALADETGGLMVDHGWLRVLGGGCSSLASLAAWNGLSPNPRIHAVPSAFIVAFDVIGGFFALDGGAFGSNTGTVHFLAPDTLEWESLGLGHSGLLQWALAADLSQFYHRLRWPGWEAETAALSGDRGLHLYPPPWTKEGKNLAIVNRRPVPMTELWRWMNDVRQQLAP